MKKQMIKQIEQLILNSGETIENLEKLMDSFDAEIFSIKEKAKTVDATEKDELNNQIKEVRILYGKAQKIYEKTDNGRKILHNMKDAISNTMEKQNNK